MNVEKLIEEIRKFPVLYDQSSEKYRNSEYKEKIWKIIATNLEAEGGAEECKRKWSSIRDQLRRTLQKRKSKHGQSALTVRKYKYEDILTFLVPHLGEREGHNKVPQPLDDKVDDDHEFVPDAQEYLAPEAYQQQDSGNENEEHITDDGFFPATSKDISFRPTRPTSPSTSKLPVNKGNFARPRAHKRKIPHREVKPQDSPASQLMAYILAEREAMKRNAPCPQPWGQQDPVDAFLYGIAPPLKSLNPILLNEAKGKIFGIVQEYEMKQLHVNASSQSNLAMSNFEQTVSPSSSAESSSSDNVSSFDRNVFYKL